MENSQILAEMKRFEQDSDLLDKTIDNIRKNFKNKFIAFKDGKIVLDGFTMDELIEKSEKEKIDLGVCVIQFISEKEMLYIL